MLGLQKNYQIYLPFSVIFFLSLTLRVILPNNYSCNKCSYDSSNTGWDSDNWINGHDLVVHIPTAMHSYPPYT